MLRKKTSPHKASEHHNSTSPVDPSRQEAIDFDLQKEFSRVEEIILDSPRIPLTRRTLIDEDKVLNQLDFVRLNLPEAFAKAQEIVRAQQVILQDAQNQAENIIQSAQRQAEQILDEMELVRRAELEANQIRQQVQQDCKALQQKTLSEVEQMRQAARQELGQLRQQTLAECEEIQTGADNYAEAVLIRIEQQLGEMLRVVHNGRQQIGQDSVPPQTQKPSKNVRKGSKE